MHYQQYLYDYYFIHSFLPMKIRWDTDSDDYIPIEELMDYDDDN